VVLALLHGVPVETAIAELESSAESLFVALRTVSDFVPAKVAEE
jgi:hypothetical protein